jgi:phage baseplate assembly protein W
MEERWLETPIRFRAHKDSDCPNGRLDGEMKTVSLEESIRASVRRVLNTPIGMALIPDYGSDIGDFRFKPLDDSARGFMHKSVIESGIKRCFPRWDWRVVVASVTGVDCERLPDTSEYSLVRVDLWLELSPALGLPEARRHMGMKLELLELS